MGEFVQNSLDFNLLLDEIESGTSGSIANSIRKLREYEVAAYSAGFAGPKGEFVVAFVEALDQRDNERMSDIERTCIRNMEGFLDSFAKLLAIQKETADLVTKLDQINTGLESSVTEYTKSCKELYDCATTLGHVDQCINAIGQVLPVLEQYSRVVDYVDNNQHYHGLRALKNLEFNHLAKISPYAFSETIINRIPKLRADIKNFSVTELTDFLERIRKLSCRLGAIVMYNVAASSGMEDMLSRLSLHNGTDATNNNNVPDPRASSTVKHPLALTQLLLSRRLNKAPKGSDDLQAELDELNRLAGVTGDQPKHSPAAAVQTLGDGTSRQCMEDLVDFGPLYRSLHINSALDEQSGFVRHYCTQRRRQCQLIVLLTPEKQASLRTYRDFFCSICGFFVVEDYLRHYLPSTSCETNNDNGSSSATTTACQTSSGGAPRGALPSAHGSASGSRTNTSVYYQTYLDELWSATAKRLVEFAQNNARDCQTVEELFNLKQFILLFNRTMQTLGFNVTRVAEMVTCVQRRFQSFLQQMKGSLETIVKEDDFTPVCIKDEKDLSQLVQLYPSCNTKEFADLSFPWHLSYSKMVPDIVSVIRHQIDVLHVFFANEDSTSEAEDNVTRSINTIFIKCLSPVLDKSIKRSENSLLRLIQLCANIEELENAVGHLDTYLQQSYTSHQANGGAELAEPASPDAINDTIQERMELLPVSQLPNRANYVRRRLQGASVLETLRGHVETLIYCHIEKCVSYLSSSIKYSQCEDVDQQNMKPSEEVLNIIKWISSTCSEAFANMPPKFTQTACLSACKFLSRSMQDRLIGPTVDRLTDASIRQASVDLTKCEDFARSQPVPGLDVNMLLLIFADIRQLLELYLRDAWHVYLNDRTGPNGNLYDRVQPSAAIRLLELLQDSEKRSGSRFLSRKDERDKRNKMNDVLRQLHNKQKHQ